MSTAIINGDLLPIINEPQRDNLFSVIVVILGAVIKQYDHYVTQWHTAEGHRPRLMEIKAL